MAQFSLPGGTEPERHQLLIGASHLQGLVGKSIQAIEFRRSASNKVLPGGAIDMTVTMSATTKSSLQCSTTFAANVGPAPLQVFDGVVTFPTSPAFPGPAIGWTNNNTVRIALTTPFLYLGDTLCIDITGTPVVGQEVPYWPADATYESLAGTVTDLGGGCGVFGGPNHSWSYAIKRSLVPGGYAIMGAEGTPGGIALAILGQKSAIGTPLQLLGFQSPAGCELHLATLDLILPTIFIPAAGMPYGEAGLEIKLPGIPSVLGSSLTTQWFDWSQTATSNAVEWTVATALPTLDMASVEGYPADATGYASSHMAHVVRFEYQ